MKNSVKLYRKRRLNRMLNRCDSAFWREDASARLAYGIAKSMGIDTSGMKPQEVWEAISKKGGSAGAKVSGSAGGGKYSKTSGSPRTAAGVKLPKPKSGTKISPVISESEAMAKADGFGKEFKREAAKLTDKDYVYQTDDKGNTYASVPCFDARVDNKVIHKGKAKSAGVQKIYDETVKRGKVITNDMLEMAKRCHSTLGGIEHSIKAGSHFAEKIDRQREKKHIPDEISDEQIASSLGDTVRFTMMSKHKDLVKNTKNLMKEFEKAGYEVIGCENKYVSDGKAPLIYKAIHLDVRSKDGQVFEVQVHSEESLSVKNENHKLYEKSTGKDGKTYTQEQKDEFNRKMIENTAKIPDPDGIKELKTFKKK